jgi:hypothetical protein
MFHTGTESRKRGASDFRGSTAMAHSDIWTPEQLATYRAMQAEYIESTNKMAKRIDDNHKSIVDGLRAVGATVQSLAALGKGAPDILCGFRNQNWTFEIKNPLMPPSKRKLTEAEEDWHDQWKGQVSVIETLDEALIAIGAAK